MAWGAQILSVRFARRGLEGNFLRSRITKVNYSPDQTFEVEWELNHRGHSRKQKVLVKWKGWPDKFNSWVAVDMIDNQLT